MPDGVEEMWRKLARGPELRSLARTFQARGTTDAVTVARFVLKVLMRDHGLSVSSVVRCPFSLAFYLCEKIFIIVVRLRASRPSQPHLVAADDALQKFSTCMKIKAYEAKVQCFAMPSSW